MPAHPEQLLARLHLASGNDLVESIIASIHVPARIAVSISDSRLQLHHDLSAVVYISSVIRAVNEDRTLYLQEDP